MPGNPLLELSYKNTFKIGIKRVTDKKNINVSVQAEN